MLNIVAYTKFPFFSSKQRNFFLPMPSIILMKLNFLFESNCLITDSEESSFSRSFCDVDKNII